MDTNYQAIVANTEMVDAAANGCILDSYDAAILEFVDEAYIREFSLLPHLFEMNAGPPQPDAYEAVSPVAISTQTHTTESDSSSLLSLRDNSTGLGLNSTVSLSRMDDRGDADCAAALSTYDFLGIDPPVHAPTRTTIPLPGFAEWKGEDEEFTMWWDLLREMEAADEPAPVADMLLDESVLECTLLFAPSEGAESLDGGLEGILSGVGLRGLEI
ncbi:uncharacterized protein C8Q71DRAFT_496581 [Rhodofomes roseus]|uniref:Uncharacterized protein n=1 Tax=Rhodofomes roseus TaxID=34475 RepID=A0ABQ8KM37_9APHY|nr:uncharacterized protein C8Q71DRAFT_496581 [Rhodofomes roseus]KAH9839113.1 hypothetical protein C8Q71DRAFT_496581 [Rhodofomes roseus]